MHKNTVSILLIGNELLNGDTRDKNAFYLSLRLSEIGVAINNISIVPDRLEEISNELARLSKKSKLIITSGGIGPTSDDMTREAISKLTKEELIKNKQAVEKLTKYAEAHNRPINENSFKQALFPKSSEVITNNYGTADAFLTNYNDCSIITLPGVPKEVEGIFEDKVAKLIKTFFPETTKLHQKYLRLFGLSESFIGTEIDKLNLSPEVITAYRPSFPEIMLVFSSEKNDVLEQAVSKVKRHIGAEFFYTDLKEQSLAENVFELLKSKLQTLAFAESCSGGLLADSFVSIPGASKVFLGSAVTYSNNAKEEILKVTSLTTHGAVSIETAKEMAIGAKEIFNSDYAISITGIAGPDGGSIEKPVGTTCIALKSPNEIDAFNFIFSWERERNRIYAATIALELLRRKLLKLPLSWERK